MTKQKQVAEQLEKTTRQEKQKRRNREEQPWKRRLQFILPPGMKQNIKAAFLLAFAGCAFVASATPCTPALGRQLPHVIQCLLTCFPLGAILVMAPKASKEAKEGRARGRD